MSQGGMRPALLNPLFAHLTALNGLGDKLAEKMAVLVGGSRIKDLLFTLPSGVVDRTHTGQLADTQNGVIGTFAVTVVEHIRPGTKKQPHKVRVEDNSGTAHLVYFHPVPGLDQRFPAGAQLVVSGKVERFGQDIHLIHPDYVLPIDRRDDIPAHETIYPLTAGISAKVRRKAAMAALDRAPNVPEWIDAASLSRGGWPTWADAIHAVHTPETDADLLPHMPARARLAYDELLAHQLSMALARHHHSKAPGNSHIAKPEMIDKLLALLPFTLTESQKQAWSEIKPDLESHNRMARLLQGDVGAGKTVVAMLAMTHLASAGRQSALMAPTEVLATQHLETITPWAEQLGLSVVMLSGRDKGKVRAEKLARIKDGADIVIGTHALFQKDVDYARLGLVVVDEQHRFGVSERMALMDKGGQVDMLVMSATPIPRTLELSLYGDLDVTRLTGKPPGRKPVDTRAVPNSRYMDIVMRLKTAIADGAQCYWICPLVAESEALDLAAAEDRFTDLQKHLGADHVGLVHGKMKPREKDAALAAFQSGETRLLVSTTVVEVGVNVPNATMMIIEHAERFGLAQLHQLRGRVGRSDAQAYCLLMYAPPLGKTARARLDILRSSNDGFRLAEEDWRLRGGGDPLGLRQSGLPDYRFADMFAHQDLLRMASDTARNVVNADPFLRKPEHDALHVLLHLFDHAHKTSWLQAG